jgi:hypothetical protein
MARRCNTRGSNPRISTLAQLFIAQIGVLLLVNARYENRASIFTTEVEMDFIEEAQNCISDVNDNDVETNIENLADALRVAYNAGLERAAQICEQHPNPKIGIALSVQIRMEMEQP